MLRLTLAGATLIAVTYGLARFALGLFAPELRDAFELSGTAMGWVMAASFLGYLVALAVAGALLARTGAQSMALVSGGCAVLGTTGVALAPGPLMLAAAAALGGLSTGWASTALAGAVQAQLAPQRRAGAQTAVNAGTSLGLIAAAPAAVLAGAAWRAAWWVFAAAAVVATLAAGRVVRRDRGAAAPAVGSAWRLSRLAAATGWRTSTRLAGTALVLGLSSAAFWTFGRELLEAGGLDAGTSRMVWLAVGVGGLAGAAAGAAARRYGLGAALVVSWSGFAAAHLGLVSAQLGLAGAVLAAGLFGAGYMALTGLLIVWAVHERPQQPGAGVAAAFLVLAAGQIAGAPLAGAILDAGGLPAAFAAAGVMATLGLLIRPAAARRGAVLTRS